MYFGSPTPPYIKKVFHILHILGENSDTFTCKVAVYVGLLQNGTLVHLLDILLQDVQLQLGETFYILFVRQFVSVNAMGLVRPQSKYIYGRLQTLVATEQQSLEAVR